MKKYWTLLLTLATAVTGGCSNRTNTDTASTVEFSGSPATGASQKPVVAVLDEQDRKVIDRISPRTLHRMDRGDSLTINDIIKLSQGGVNDDAILTYLGETGSVYNLTQAQVRRLQEAGVSQRVINFMIQSGRSS